MKVTVYRRRMAHALAKLAMGERLIREALLEIRSLLRAERVDDAA